MGRRAAPVGDRGKLTGMLRRGPNRTVGSRFSWASVLLVAVSLLASACSSASATPAKNQPDGAMLDRALHAWTRLPSWFVASPPHLARGVRLEPRVRIPRRQQQGGVHQRRGHCAGELARVAHLVDGVPDHRSGQRIQDLDDPYHQLPRHTPSARNHRRPAGLWTLPHRPRLASPPGVALLAHGSPESGKGARSWAIGHLLSTGHSRRRLSPRRYQ